MIYVLGSGGTGGELTVNAPAGVKVIATNSETGRTYTRTANADGVAVFKGLPEGTYNVTITDGERTSDPVPANVVYKSETTIDFFQATIKITYPEGSTCTCSDGETTFTAPDTTGTWTCIVPNAGTWTVTATDGEQIKTVDVEIAAAGEVKAVSNYYDLYLFKSGTGGLVTWTTSGYGVTLNSGGMDNTHMSATSYPPGNAGGFGTDEAIDLTRYATFHASVKGYYYIDNSASWQYIYIIPQNNGKGGTAAATFQTSNAQYSKFTTHSFDISALSGKYYIFFKCRSLYQQVIDTNNVWLTVD